MLGLMFSFRDAYLVYLIVVIGDKYFKMFCFFDYLVKNFNLYLEYYFGKYCCYCIFFCVVIFNVGYEVKELVRIKILLLEIEGFL